jgi:class 3 adenylate cyclase
MKCPRCQHENRAGAKFCEQCAAALARFCINCGGPLPETAKFCPACAHPVTTSPERDTPPMGAGAAPSGPTAEGERRQATVLFADISGYTSLCAAMDAEQVQALLSRFYGITDPAIQAYGGHVIDHAGDGVVAVFGAPVAYGNDGERAVRAAIELHGAAAQLVDGAGKPLQLHIGIASGEVVAAVMTGGAQPKYAVTGDAVNLAARLDAKAQAGETIISDALHATISHLVEADALGAVEVKGFDQPVRVWRVRAVQTSGAERRPFVGRHSELRQLTGALETAIESGAGVAICVRGEPGIGKTRLVDELRARAAARGYACHTGHVLDFGVGRGQDAIPVILKDLLQIDARADEAARRSAVERGLREGRIEPEHEVHINDLLDLPQRAEMQAVFDAMDNATRTQRAAEAVATVVQRAALEQPRLIVIEDIHWASPALLRHFARLTISATQSAVVFVMTSRIEGDPLDKVWRASAHGSPLMTIDLGPLRAEEARELAGGFIEASNRFAASCIERAEGNPLFLEQLLRNIQESEAANIPPTIQSLVLARMDRLGAHDKQALQAASVVGKRSTLRERVRLPAGARARRAAAAHRGASTTARSPRSRTAHQHGVRRSCHLRRNGSGSRTVRCPRASTEGRRRTVAPGLRLALSPVVLSRCNGRYACRQRMGGSAALRECAGGLCPGGTAAVGDAVRRAYARAGRCGPGWCGLEHHGRAPASARGGPTGPPRLSAASYRRRARTRMTGRYEPLRAGFAHATAPPDASPIRRFDSTFGVLGTRFGCN